MSEPAAPTSALSEKAPYHGLNDPDLPRRLFIYHYRIFDKYGVHPLTLAIFVKDAEIGRAHV